MNDSFFLLVIPSECSILAFEGVNIFPSSSPCTHLKVKESGAGITSFDLVNSGGLSPSTPFYCS